MLFFAKYSVKLGVSLQLIPTYTIYMEIVKIYSVERILSGWRVVNLPWAGRVSLRSQETTDNTLRAGNAPMFWRKFNGREV